MERIIKIRKVAITDTLLELRIGEDVTFTERQAKSATIKATIFRLSKKGYAFETITRGLIARTKVTRLK